MIKRYAVIGGIAGGVSAAMRLRRLDEHAQITIFERGSQISFACCSMPYYIGGVVEKDDLSCISPESIRQTYDIDVKLLHDVLGINRHNKQIEVRDLQTGQESNYAFDKLIIATGSVVSKPPLFDRELPGVFKLKGREDMLALSDFIEKSHARRAAVIGGGAIGLQTAENLSRRGIKTCVIEREDHAVPFMDRDMARFAKAELENNGIALVKGTTVSELIETDEGMRLELMDGRSVFVDIVVVSTGMKPDVTLARKAGLGIGITGGIIVDEKQQTTDKDIYAVGDAVELECVSGGKVLLPMAAPAVRQGHVAADNICGISSKYRHVLGIRIIKLFDIQLAGAGLTEVQLAERGIRYEKVYTRSNSHDSFFSRAEPLTVKLLFDRKNGRVFGVQIAGRTGVDKRLDVFAAAMQTGLTADRLADLELAYAPMLGTPKDAVNIAGSAASDVMAGLTDVVHWHDIQPESGYLLLDVRGKEERLGGSIDGSLHIPLAQLRDRIGELPAGREILAYSQYGRRGYLAERMLKQHGFTARNLSGGYGLYSLFRGSRTGEGI